MSECSQLHWKLSHLCFLSTEMECPIGYTCKQCNHKEFRRGWGREPRLFVQYKQVFSSGAAADLPSAPTKHPPSRGEFQEGLGGCFEEIKGCSSMPYFYVSSLWAL